MAEACQHPGGGSETFFSMLLRSCGPGQYQCLQSLVWRGMQNTSMERMSSYSNGGSGANSDTEAALHIAAPQHCGKLEAVPQVCSEASCTSCCAVPADPVPLEVQSKGQPLRPSTHHTVAILRGQAAMAGLKPGQSLQGLGASISQVPSFPHVLSVPACGDWIVSIHLQLSSLQRFMGLTG